MAYQLTQHQNADGKTMVGSYLICDACGRFGPPAGFLSQDGLRLCYQCWFQERQGHLPDAAPQADRPTPDADPNVGDTESGNGPGP